MSLDKEARISIVGEDGQEIPFQIIEVDNSSPQLLTGEIFNAENLESINDHINLTFPPDSSPVEEHHTNTGENESTNKDTIIQISDKSSEIPEAAIYFNLSDLSASNASVQQIQTKDGIKILSDLTLSQADLNEIDDRGCDSPMAVTEEETDSVTHASEGISKPTEPISESNQNSTKNSTKEEENQAATSATNQLWPLIDDKGILYCTRCQYRTDKKQNWYKHRQNHLGKKKHHCSDCDYQTGSASNMRRHRLKHEGIKEYICGLCNASFRQKTHLQRHCQKAHVERKVSCMACPFTAVDTTALARHVESKHKDLVLINEGSSSKQEDGEKITPQLSTKQFMCPHCQFMDPSRRVVQQHIKFHLRGGSELKMFCTQCSFVTDCASRLQRHQRTHTKEKPFMCKLCNYKANQREHVVRHLKVKHQVTIPTGKQRAEQQKKLSNPLPVAVEGIVKDNSNTRAAKVTNQTSSNKLIKVNRGDSQAPDVRKFGREKLFACNFCTMTFSKLLNLYKHVHLQHAEMTADMQNSSCVICDFSAGTHQALLTHMRRHTANEEAKMLQCLLAGRDEEGMDAAISSDSNSIVINAIPENLTDLVTTSNESGYTIQKSRKKHSDMVRLLRESGGRLNENFGPALKKTVWLSLEDEGNSVVVPVVVEQPQRKSVENRSEEIAMQEGMDMEKGEFSLEECMNKVGEEIEFVTVSNEHEVIQEVVEDEHNINGMDLLSQLPGMEIQQSSAGDMDLANINMSSLPLKQEVVAGDFIEINGETYQVKIGDSVEPQPKDVKMEAPS